MTLLRRVWRVVTIAVVVIGTITVPLFWRWNVQHNAELLQGSEVVSTANGHIEVAVVGDGIPMLQLHGSPGGYDQSLPRDTARPQRTARVKTIAVSRPGYLRTPLTSGRTPEEQADLFAALLTTLGIPRVIVQGSSAGSYSAIQFALRHADRTIGLILYAPDLGSHQGGSAFAGSVVEDYGRWLVTTRLLFPVIGPRLVAGLDTNDDVAPGMARALIRSTIPASAHKAGRRNDLEQRRNPDIDRWPVEEIRVPTLILHGTSDENTSYERSADLANRVPGAKLVSIEGGDHLAGVTRSEDVSAAIDMFIATLPASPLVSP
jgi:pimeloyl-ACP methyl ester carboxylesterase